MTLPVKHPFANGPRTIESTDERGRPCYEICARALTPLRAQFADFLSWCGTIGLMGSGLYFVGAEIPHADWEFVAAFFGPMLTQRLQALGFGALFKKSRTIRISADSFSFKTLTGWQHYDRNLSHSIALYPHDKTQQEAFDLDLSERKAAAKGRIIKRKRYYGESFHLVFEYLGQRIDVMDVYSEKQARMIASRLKAVDAVVDSGIGKGKGEALKPEDDWSEGPGALPGPEPAGALPQLPGPAPVKQLEWRNEQ